MFLSRSSSIDPNRVAALAPKILWIELTSRCPYDCIFCSRRLLRADGLHMDFHLFQSLIRQLDGPEIIRLNYSGESIHYPYLAEAIGLAKSTGAATELVTALSSASPTLLRRIVESGLDRLTVSLHTLDDEQYRAIYRFSSLEALLEKIADLVSLKKALGAVTPALDFAFVAIEDNLDQLPRIASYAREIGVNDIFVHPVLKRDPIPHDFSAELESGKLTPAFKVRLRETIEKARAACPGVSVTISNADALPAPCLGPVPRAYPAALPSGARIHTCDQNPWDTVHVLANGDVVVCEVHDRMPLGNLWNRTLEEIWHGAEYRRFRKNYMAGRIPQCRECPWKAAYLPSALKSALAACDGASPQMLRGWHGEEGSGVIWSKPQALLLLRRPVEGNRLRIAGLLPARSAETDNVLEIQADGQPVGRITNISNSLSTFDRSFEIPPRAARELYLAFSTRIVFRPSRAGAGADIRDLGFALSRIEVSRA